ncbi:MAG: M4 family metallopeptidase [Chitinophagaceae bacterium]|nr:M4 family metallopeptidase [Chitinophagaceae bacterium]
MQLKLAGEKQGTANSFYKFELNAKIPTQAGILFSADVDVQKTALQNWLAAKLELRQGIDDFRTRMESVAYKGSNISKLQQYFKGIKVEHGVVSVADIAGSVRLLQLEFYSLPDNLQVQPTISEEAALTKAMEFTGASSFVWQKPSTSFWQYQKPSGELVIVEDIFNAEKGTMCLAYKFDVFAAEPASRQNIYVNVLNGKVVFADATIKHLDGKHSSGHDEIGKQPGDIPHSLIESKDLMQNQKTTLVKKSIAPTVFDSATGFLKYSFDQKFLTEKVSPTLYRLRAQSEFPNTVVYETYNINHKTLVNAINSDITDFTDNDNDWNEPAYGNDTTNAALDIHWGIEQIIKYWRDVHNRNSFDNNFSAIKNYFHYGIRYGGAFWSSQAKSMFYGDGSQDSQGFNALASIDVTGHELAHGVCDFTAALVYKRESGALNEGFSDIWGACIDNYINKNFETLNKTPFKIADEIVETPGRDCLRDMQKPKRWAQPDCYKDVAHNWFDVNVENCPTPISPGNAGNNDDCGVHANSGVLNKWFYLITEGDTMTNVYNDFYTVDSLGFDKSERIAYYTEMILTPNSGYEAARIASMNAVQILAASPNTLGITLADTAVLATARRAVGVTTDSIYNMANTPFSPPIHLMQLKWGVMVIYGQAPPTTGCINTMEGFGKKPPISPITIYLKYYPTGMGAFG